MIVALLTVLCISADPSRSGLAGTTILPTVSVMVDSDVISDDSSTRIILRNTATAKVITNDNYHLLVSPTTDANSITLTKFRVVRKRSTTTVKFSVVSNLLNKRNNISVPMIAVIE